MKIWLDGQCLQSASLFRGIGRYQIEYWRALSELTDSCELLVSFNAQMQNEALRAKDAVSDFIVSENIHIWHGATDGGEVQNGNSTGRQLSEIALCDHVSTIAPDIAVSTSLFEGMNDCLSPFMPPPDFPIPTANIFYDAIPLHYPELYLPTTETREAYYRRLSILNNFDLQLAISDYSKSDLREIYSSMHVTSIGAGVSRTFDRLLEASPNRVPIQNNRGQPFRILYVGGLDPRKNVLTLISAIAQLPAQLRNWVELIVVGDCPLAEEERLIQTWRAFGLPVEGFMVRGFLTDSKLFEEYQSANLVVQPSLLEGFGLTVLEALKAGVPVIASNTGALPEVLHEPALMFDPLNVTSISDRLEWAMRNPKELNGASSRASAHAKKFTWSAAARTTLSVFEKVSQTSSTKNKSYSSRDRMRAIGADEKSIKLLQSASQIPNSNGNSLFIDITSTARVDHKTGIQRVVRKTVERSELLTEDIWKQSELIASDYCKGFFPAMLDAKKSGVPWDVNRGQIIGIRRGDTVLMLDSSWEHHQAHSATLKLARLKGVEIYSVIYDLVPLRMAALCHEGMPTMFQAWLFSALEYSTGLICISRAVADEVLRLLESISFPRPLKVGHWRLGSDINTSIVTRNNKANHQNHFISVGTVEPRKGHETMLEAFELLWQTGDTAKLTLIGKRGWDVDKLADRIRSHPEYGRKLHWLEQASDKELSDVYARSDALIAASFGEGFGLPIVEALRLGTAVIASDIPVFREVAGTSDMVSYFQVGSPESLAQSVASFRNPTANSFNLNDSTISWDASVSQLKKVVAGQNWYQIYKPIEKSEYRSFSFQPITKPIEMNNPRAAELRIVSSCKGDEKLLPIPRLILVKNNSGVPWCSQGGLNGKFEVTLNVYLGEKLTDQPLLEKPFTFVVPDGEHHIVSLGTLRSLLPRQCRTITLAVHQSGRGVVGEPINIELYRRNTMQKHRY